MLGGMTNRQPDPFRLLLDTFGSQAALRRALSEPQPTRQAVSLWFTRRVIPRHRVHEIVRASNWTIRHDALLIAQAPRWMPKAR